MPALGQTKTSILSGIWSNPLIWSPAGVPTATDNVLINNNHTIDLIASASCSNIQVGNTGSATFRLAGVKAVSLTVSGNITVNNGSSFTIKPSSNAFHSLYVGGDILNNGNFDLRRNVISLCNAFFTGNNNQQLLGSGAAEFNFITVDKGSSGLNVLDVSVASFVAPSNFLKMINGTFRFSVPSQTIIPFTGITDIGPTCGLALNAANAVISTSAGVTFSGRLELNAGILNIGNGPDEDLSCTGGTIAISGGSLNIAGRLNSSGGTHFSMSDGCLTVPVSGSGSTLFAPFEVSTGSVFNMSGGTIVIPREGGTGSQHLGITITAPGTISGGTLQLGNDLSPVSQTIGVNSTAPVPNLLVYSPNVTAQCASAMNVLNDITIRAGVLDANNQALSLGGNWQNTGGIFLPALSTVSLSSAAPQTIFKNGIETFYALHLSGTGTKTFLAPLSIASDFVIGAGTTADVSVADHSLSVAGNFINNGGFDARKGLVLLNGSSQQQISGSSATTFYNLSVNNTSGVSLAQAAELEGALSLSNGNFALNSHPFTMISNSAGTARIGPITGTGDITGDVTVQRYIPGGATGWSLLGSPISSALSFSDWDDDLFISCVSCPDGYVANFPSIWSYDESAPGLFDDTLAYVPITAITDPLVQGKGYWVYSGTGQYSTADQHLDMTGPVRKFAYTIPLSYSNYGSAVNDGWNLVHNPYPSPVSWSQFRNGNSNIDNAYYTYNADHNAGTGAYSSFVNGISSPQVSSGGTGDIIPMCQAFFVHCTANTSLQAQEGIKSVADQSLLKTSSAGQVKPLLRIILKGPYGFRDETVLYFETGASQGFDMGYDAMKLRGQNPYAPVIALRQGQSEFQVNGIAPVTGSVNMDLQALTGYPGNYTITVEEEGSPLLPGTCFSLSDKFQMVTTDLRKNSYSFYLSDTTSVARFNLAIVNNSLSSVAQVESPDCLTPQAGKIMIQPAGSGPWTYSWFYNNLLIRSATGSGADSIQLIQGGNYHVQAHTIGQCDNLDETFFISTPELPVAAFSCSDSVDISVDPLVLISNTSKNAAACYWSFGTGDTSIHSGSPAYLFKSKGSYTISLKCVSSTNCVDSVSRVVKVVESRVTDLSEFGRSSLLLKTIRPNLYIVSGLSGGAQEVKLCDALGRKLEGPALHTPGDAELKADLDHLPAGIYLLSIRNGMQQQTFRLPVLH